MADSSTAPATGTTSNGADDTPSIHQKSREKVPWGPEIWDAMDRTVHDEVTRSCVHQKFIPCHKVHPKTTSVEADVINIQSLEGENMLMMDEGAMIRLNEMWIEFALTPQQVHEAAEAKNPDFATPVLLARKGANYLSQAMDLLVFQGVNAYFTSFFQSTVSFRPGQYPTDTGLLSLPVASGTLPTNFTPPPTTSATIQSLQVQPITGQGPGVIWGTNSFMEAAAAYAGLNGVGQCGPFVAAYHPSAFADSFAPVEGLVITADRIKPMMDAGFYGSGGLASSVADPAVSPAPTAYGIVMSLGGTVDVVVGQAPAAVFRQEDPQGNFVFGVMARLALRVLDSTGIVRLDFMPSA
jgi:hypothetical protein